jgi:hypothetical protein
LEESALILAEILIDFMEDVGSPVHPNYYRMRSELAARLNRR